MPPGSDNASPPPKKRSGCLTAVLVLLVLGAIGAGVGGYLIYRVLSTPEARAVMSVVKSAVSAPGRKQLQAAGCDAVLVIDMHAMAELAQKSKQLEPADKKRMLEEAKTPTITCSMKKAVGAPSCAHLAQVYVDAVHPKGTFAIVVGVTGSKAPLCAEKYDATGKDLGPAVVRQAGGTKSFHWEIHSGGAAPPPVPAGDAP